MSATSEAGWRFLPPDLAAPEDLDSAVRAGPAALSRALRSLRAEIGAARTAARLRALPDRPGHRLRLLVAVPIRPEVLADALTVAFAIAGIVVDIECVEGVAQLFERSGRGGDVDLVLVLDTSEGAEPEASLVALAADSASLLRAPVALLRFGASTAESSLVTGVDRLTIGLSSRSALDRRFAASFGTILTAAAADVLADGAAGWAARQTGRAPKLLVTDLDGTLWDGILGEQAGGGPVPPLHVPYAAALKALAARGIVVAVASRNEPADVDAAFATGATLPLKFADIAALAVGWEDKAALVERVLRRLGLGAEHAVFVDDDPVNCAKVAARFPAMDVRLFTGDPGAFAKALLADPLLFGGGAEGPERAGRYRAKAEVDRLRDETPDVGAFLAALDTQLTLARLGPDQLKRAAELAGRVNQFVLRDVRPNAVELAARRSPFDVLVRLDDAFGAHGIVGLILATRDGGDLVIDNLYLSCRALERGVEDAMLRGLFERARQAGIARLVGRVEALPRNAPALAFVGRVARLAADGSFVYPAGGRLGALGEGAPRIVWQRSGGEDEDGDAA